MSDRSAPHGGPLAQLVEQLTLNQRVGGSSPPRLTIFFNDLRQVPNELSGLPLFVCHKQGSNLIKRLVWETYTSQQLQ